MLLCVYVLKLNIPCFGGPQVRKNRKVLKMPKEKMKVADLVGGKGLSHGHSVQADTVADRFVGARKIYN